MKGFFQALAMVAIESFWDTLKLLPLLLVVYFLIELLEYKNVFKFEKSRLLSGRASPALGACIGCVPQCGFSVISSELYAERKISMGALVAVFIATSDEAFPLMLASLQVPSLLMLVACKLVFAIAIGYLTYFLQRLFFKSSQKKLEQTEPVETESTNTQAEQQGELQEEHQHIHACCNHDIENNKFNFIHPIVHCLKIMLYIFVVNVAMGMIITGIGGETALSDFLQKSSLFQPLLAVVVGLIPNCVSSVVLTDLYLMGGLSFGSLLAGLCVNAGIGIFVLFKQNKHIKENLFIMSVMLVSGLAIGYSLHFIPFGFLNI